MKENNMSGDAQISNNDSDLGSIAAAIRRSPYKMSLSRALEEIGWEYYKLQKPCTSLADFSLCQAEIVEDVQDTVLELASHFDHNFGLALKVLSDCHGDSRAYSVREWIITKDFIFKRVNWFIHTDENSIFEGATFFDGIDLTRDCHNMITVVACSSDK